jgi:hypothetical protein
MRQGPGVKNRKMQNEVLLLEILQNENQDKNQLGGHAYFGEGWGANIRRHIHPGDLYISKMQSWVSQPGVVVYTCNLETRVLDPRPKLLRVHMPGPAICP